MGERSRFSGLLVVLLVVGVVTVTVGTALAAAPTADEGATTDGGPTGDAAIGGSSVADAQLAGSYEERTFEGRRYLAYVPSGPAPAGGYPLVVMLHGCTQTPRGFANATGMSRVAEAENFVVIYPDQTLDANGFECWNWFEKANNQRGSGEARLIAGMTHDALQTDDTDRARVYVAGLSAGAAMATNLAGEYPDLYAAVGSHSGLEYHAVEDEAQTIAAQDDGGIDPADRAQRAYERAGDLARPIPAVVFHATDDRQVSVVNGNQTVAWAVHLIDLASDGAMDGDIDTDPEAVEHARTAGGINYTRYSYGFGDQSLVEYYLLRNVGHAWSGGNAAEDYTLPEGPDASRLLWQFFATHSHPNPSFDGPAPSPTTAAPTPTTTGKSTGTQATATTTEGTPTDTEQPGTEQPGTEPPTEETMTPSDGGGPGFGVVVALAALAAATVALLARQRRDG